jgi:ABC-type dipeptide/oligopeptide/nickel transport system permease subunit
MGPLSDDLARASSASRGTTTTTLTADTDSAASTETAPADTAVPITDTTAVEGADSEDVFTEITAPPMSTSDTIVDAEQQEQDRVDLLASTQTSTRCFFLGTTGEGTDVLSAIINGTRTSLSISLISVFLGGLIGCLLGITSAYLRGWFDRVMLLVFNIILSIPTLVLAFALIAIFATPLNPSDTVADSSRLKVLIASLVIVIIPQLGRIARAAALQWINRDFVTASRSIGASNFSILTKRIIPNVVPSIFAILFLALGTVIVVEGSLSLLGVGLNNGNSWGSLLARNSGDLVDYPHVIYVPVIVIAFTIISTNKLGDLIRASLDKREAKI